ncbi:hypothetical protein [Flammeovirga aprica]|uniref:Class I SAM-dependent methyltransferase n=1 Tax=Flammeovirga aprica JL-4 TaxID=694437 RepID=A0A7X9RUD0_9BACT|nr:hypothetical protein [Flammeovirga aprica]NME68859.1 hypothetical protein [Flammeovirga aprica JL-4]
MKRVHLFEFEDQKWLPSFLRNYATDFLQFLSNKTKMYQPIIPIIEKGLEHTPKKQIVDLGSGGGGGLVWLNEELLKKEKGLKILITDLYPNLPAFQRTKEQSLNFEFIDQSVDARQVPSDLKGLRTQFLSFHHFKPEDAKQILENAVKENAPIAIFEAQERSIPSVIAMLFSPLTVLLTTPLIRPFRLGRLFFTYLIPIVPLLALWDGVVSSFRTYSVKEMKDLIQQVENHELYDWEVNKVKSGPGVILYLLGTRK